MGKHSRFPVDGNHAIIPGKEKNENPLLINPVIDDPNEHLNIDLENGMLKFKSTNGEMCIKIFGLNLRDELVDGRKKAISEVQAKLSQFIHNPSKRVAILKELTEIKDGKRAHSIAGISTIEEHRSLLSSL